MPSILCRLWSSDDTCVQDHDIERIVTYQLREFDHRAEVALVDGQKLSLRVPCLLLDLCTTFNAVSRLTWYGDVPVIALRPLPWCLHPKMSLFGCIRAKCFAASSPIPLFDPVTSTLFPARSAYSGGGSDVHWSMMKAALEYFMAFPKRR